MQHQTLFVFDIETIPDAEAVKGLLSDVDASKTPQELRQLLEEYHLEQSSGKSSFVKTPFHKVVVISFLEADIYYDGPNEHYELKELRSGGKEDAEEKELVEGFFHYLSKAKPRLVSYNGRGFDLPVLKHRAMKYGIGASWLYQSGDKWSNYTHRYSTEWHTDLLDVLTDFGASGRARLNEICAILGFPGKIGVDGSDVAPLYDEGKVKDIRHYCETDVLNTYLVYLRYKKHSGHLSTIGYNQAIGDVLSYIDNEKSKREYLGEFFDAWSTSCQDKFTIE